MFIVCSDLHITEKRPGNRKECDWAQLCLDMFEQVLKYADEMPRPKRFDDRVVYVAGDFFDKYEHGLDLTHKVMDLINKYRDVSVCIIPGNHDLKSHSQDLIAKSSICTLGFLNSCEVFRGFETYYTLSGTSVDLFPFGDELTHRGGDVAIIHEFVYKDKPWHDCDESGSYKSIINKMRGYKLIIAGDNHDRFIAKYKGCTILNCGSMMRRTIKQIDYKPAFYVIDDDLSIDTIEFDIEEDVFDLSNVERIQKKDAAIAEVADQMKKGIKFKLDYKANMKKFLKKNNIEDDVCDLINEAME